MKTILLFQAHPDDVTCIGGTAWMLKDRYRLHTVSATKGERGRPDWTMKKTAAVRQKEQEKESRLLGAELTFLNRIDAELFADADICHAAAQIIRQVRPVAIFTLWPVDYHPDHSAMSEIARKAHHLAASEAELLFYEAGYSTQTTQFTPDCYVDITPVLDRKLQLTRCHACQNVKGRLEKALTEQAAFRGGLAGCPYAEGFKSLRPWKNTTHSVLTGLGEKAGSKT